MKFLKPFALIITLISAMSFSSKAAPTDIICKTPRDKRVFVIKNNRIVLQNRDLASVAARRTKRSAKGFTKFFSYEGKSHKLHIQDRSSFSEFDDYISIRNKKGHEITYPLTCDSEV